MDSYQPIYDAVRSRIGSFNASQLCDQIAAKFDISCAVEQLRHGFITVAFENTRPCVLFRPKIAVDGNKWCALYGDNLQDGVVGFGNSPALAMQDFDKNFNETLK